MITPEEIQAAISALPDKLPDSVCPTIPTPTGRMKLSSLRPGDWIKAEDHVYSVLVTINSGSLRRCCLRWDGVATESSWRYAEISAARFAFLGHGKRRWWFKFLPKWIRKHVCEFDRP